MYGSTAAVEDGVARPLSDLAGRSGADLLAESEPYFTGNRAGAA